MNLIDRCGHGADHNHSPDERSPVFLQFLDCVHQVMIQFPNVFEFNDLFLVFVADHFHSGLFGNFLGNTDKQRTEEMKVQETTRSIWSHVLSRKSQFLNESFANYDRPIWPSCAISRMVVWHRYFSRWDSECHPSSLMLNEWHDDWYEYQSYEYNCVIVILGVMASRPRNLFRGHHID